MSAEPHTTIRNFGKVNSNYYRGAQPRPSEYMNLVRLGVKTVIDLTGLDTEDYSFARAQEAGLLYRRLPMSDTEYPLPNIAPSFLTLATDPLLAPVYVHCKGGRHRTGAMTAVFRMSVDRWTLDRAMKELESYDFGWLKWRWWGHQELKRYLKDYWASLNQK